MTNRIVTIIQILMFTCCLSTMKTNRLALVNKQLCKGAGEVNQDIFNLMAKTLNENVVVEQRGVFTYYKVSDEDDRDLFLLAVNLQNYELDFSYELEMLKLLKDEYFVLNMRSPEDCYYDGENVFIFVPAFGQDLATVLKGRNSLLKRQLWKLYFATYMFYAVLQLHSKNVFNIDLKPENIYVRSPYEFVLASIGNTAFSEVEIATLNQEDQNTINKLRIDDFKALAETIRLVFDREKRDIDLKVILSDQPVRQIIYNNYVRPFLLKLFDNEIYRKTDSTIKDEFHVMLRAAITENDRIQDILKSTIKQTEDELVTKQSSLNMNMPEESKAVDLDAHFKEIQQISESIDEYNEAFTFFKSNNMFLTDFIGYEKSHFVNEKNFIKKAETCIIFFENLPDEGVALLGNDYNKIMEKDEFAVNLATNQSFDKIITTENAALDNGQMLLTENDEDFNSLMQLKDDDEIFKTKITI